MNILLVDHAPFFGGSESFLLDLLTALDRDAFSPIVVTDPRSPVLDRFRASGANVLTTPFPQINHSPFLRSMPRLLRSGAGLARIARDARVDVIHTFTARTHLVGAIAAHLSGIPLLWRIADDTLPGWAMSLFARAPRVIVAVSHWITTRYPNIRFDGLAPDGARPPSGISRSNARASLGLSADEFVVAHVGRLVRWKGQDVFIRALARASELVPNLRGLVVGGWSAADDRPGALGGGESYSRELRALAVELALDARVVFTGFVRDPGVVYAASDIFAHSSTLPEPFGRTVIEAMMAGCPVIASNAGALPEIVTDESGFLTPPGDAVALAEAIVRLASSRDLREQFGNAARKRAESEYTLERMARRIERFYRLAIQKSKIENRKSEIENAYRN